MTLNGLEMVKCDFAASCAQTFVLTSIAGRAECHHFLSSSAPAPALAWISSPPEQTKMVYDNDSFVKFDIDQTLKSYKV